MSKMVPDLEQYFSEFLPARSQLLLAMEQEAAKEGIPIVGPVVGGLLALLGLATGARKILELGTATGYSAIYLAGVCHSLQGHLTTLEKDQGMAQRAQANFVAAGLDRSIEIKVGNASDLMATMAGPFDYIFMDIDKQGYADALCHCQRLLKIGGLLVTDNVGFQEADEFNRKIFSEREWQTVHLLCFLPGHSPEHDGLSLAVRVA